VSAFWHPLSAVYLDEPRALASPAIVRMILGAEGHIDLRYAGDRMWPTLRHGEPIRVVPLRSSALPHGGVVLAMADGALDVVRLRVSRHAMTGTCDADPAPPRPISREDVLGEMGTRRRGPAVPASALRLWLDLREAVTGEPESSGDPASTVRDKYDAQALHYAKGAGDALDAEVERSVRGSFAPGSRVLVAGSGTGRESFALEALGYEVVGVDFSAAMVEAARHSSRRTCARTTSRSRRWEEFSSRTTSTPSSPDRPIGSRSFARCAAGCDRARRCCCRRVAGTAHDRR
jgi:hypothetical protein